MVDQRDARMVNDCACVFVCEMVRTSACISMKIICGFLGCQHTVFEYNAQYESARTFPFIGLVNTFSQPLCMLALNANGLNLFYFFVDSPIWWWKNGNYQGNGENLMRYTNRSLATAKWNAKVSIMRIIQIGFSFYKKKSVCVKEHNFFTLFDIFAVILDDSL